MNGSATETTVSGVATFRWLKKSKVILLDVHQYNIKKYAYNQGSCSFALYCQYIYSP